MEKYYACFSPDYFDRRLGNDPKRQACFQSEKVFINQYIKQGKLLDIGCSTGEFIAALEWKSGAYGMEISDHAKAIATKNGIRFDRDIFNSEAFFDLIIFRGTIQHIDTPFAYLKQSFKALKPGGYVVFLATPNANSLYYKLWNDLPFLDPAANFYIPSNKTLPNAMSNFGFTLKKIRYPYWRSPYASVVRDHFNFIKKCLGFKVKFPFWKNSMDLIFQKPE